MDNPIITYGELNANVYTNYVVAADLLTAN